MSQREQYGVLFPRFWEGTTGRQIQGKGRDAVILAAYLASCRHANMIGLYELPLVFLERELTVLKGRMVVLKAFQGLQEVSYATYDLETEYVWVREMARIRVGLAPGEKINADDKKHTAAKRLYAAAKPNPFLVPFHEHYRVTLQLSDMRLGTVLRPVESEIGEIQKGHRGGIKGANGRLRTETVQKHQTSQVQGSVPVPRSKAVSAAAKTPLDTEPDEDDADRNVEVITALVTMEVLAKNVPEDDWYERAKDLCAANGIAYNSDVITKAVKSAAVRWSLTHAPMAGVS
jgi:hypothetical protein